MYGRPVRFRLARSRGISLRFPPATTFRIALLVLCALLTAVRGEGDAVAWLIAFASVTLALSLRPLTGRVLLAALGAEAVLAAMAVVGTGGSVSPLLPYLMAPAFEAGTVAGFLGTAIVGIATAVTLAVGRVGVDMSDSTRDYSVAGVEWVLLTVAVGLLATWARRLRLTTPAEPADASYVAAYRLLSQLRTVARQLTAGLDAAALAQGLLHDLREPLPYDRAAVLVRGTGDPRTGQRSSTGAPVTGSCRWCTCLRTRSPGAPASRTTPPSPKPGCRSSRSCARTRSPQA